jgi:large subunit ribosomal protein L22
MKEARAVLKNCPTSPRKMRYVVDMIRGLDVEKALNLVKFSSKHASTDVEKLILSAIANWQAANEGARIEDSQVYIKTMFVDGGRMLKRWLPAPQGRAYRKRKRSNHVTLIVDSKLNTGETIEEQAEESELVEATEPVVTETVETETAVEAKAPKKKSTKSKKEKE